MSLLLDEVEHLDPAGAIALRVAADPTEIRRDGMLRARARVEFPGVVVSFTSESKGPLSFATDAYEQRWTGDLAGWQANVRAIALSLKALRAVDRYGVTRSGEQYAGWRQIESGPATPAGFASPDAAARWIRTTAAAAQDRPVPDSAPLPDLYRLLARRMHPDMNGGDQTAWHRLDEARRLLEGTDLW